MSRFGHSFPQPIGLKEKGIDEAITYGVLVKYWKIFSQTFLCSLATQNFQESFACLKYIEKNSGLGGRDTPIISTTDAATTLDFMPQQFVSY